MGYDLNFSLLGAPVDIAGAVNTGYEHGRQQRLQGMQESAFALLARNPNSAEGRALLVASGHPDQAQQFRQWGREDMNDAFRARLLGGPSASAPAIAPANAAPTPSAFAPANAAPAPAGAPPAVNPMAPAVGQPPAPSAPPAASTGSSIQPDPEIMRQWFAADPAGAREFLTGWTSLNDAQREMVAQKYTAAIPLLTTALSLPEAQRRAFIQSHQAELVQNGWTPEELAGFDPTDTNVQYVIRRGLPLAQQRDFFAPTEAGPGTVGRDRFSNDVRYANPTQPRTETSYDAQGNQMLATVPGAPAIGPGANLFGGGAQGGAVAPSTAVPQVGEVRRGYRFRGGNPADPQSWEQVGGQPTGSSDLDNWNNAGRPGPGGPGTFR